MNESREQLQQRLTEVRAEAAALEKRLAALDANETQAFSSTGYRTSHEVLVGMMLGVIGAGAALIFNVVGSVLIRLHPLELIRVYLTFPLGEEALSIDHGIALAIGCGLYLVTGAGFGIGFHLILSRYFGDTSNRKRIVVASVLGLLLWFVNYHVLLANLQPALFGGNWVVESIPTWVAVLTHLVFAWTLFLVDEWGTFDTHPHIPPRPTAPVHAANA